MNDKTLKETLSRLTVPPADATARGRALARAEIAYVNRPKGAGFPFENAGRQAAMADHAKWEGGLRTRTFAMVCLAAVVLSCFLFFQARRMGHEPTIGAATPSQQDRLDARDAKLLAEMGALFRGQLEAVISQGADLSLDLDPAASAATTPAPQQPLAVILRRGKEIVRVLSFSGRKVCIQLGGRKECFEPLVDDNGKVFLAGQDFVWSNENPTLVAGYRVQAYALSL